MRFRQLCLLSAALAVALTGSPLARDGAAARPPLERLSLPPGFSIALWARVPGARSLAVADEGARVYVGTLDSRVYAILDLDRDGIADGVVTIADQLAAPNGIAVGPEAGLFIAERDRIIRLDGNGRGAVVVPRGVLPDGSRDGGRHAGFGPDGRLYVTVGEPCEACAGRGFAGTILRMLPDGHELQIFAQGIRNPGGFDWHPRTGQMFFTDRGADHLEDRPPLDELNFAPRPGLHFGFRHGNRHPAPQGSAPPQGLTGPVLEFEGQGAALGIAFYDGAMFPPEYRHDAVVAQHGSRNGGGPAGPRILRVRFAGDLPVGQEVFIEGWLGRNGDVLGRPVDLEELPDGSLLISDDLAGVVYRVTYRAPAGARGPPDRPRERRR